MTFEHFKSAGNTRAKSGIRYARQHGILQKISPYDSVLSLDSVKFWLTQLNESGHKNSTSRYGTKQMYLHGLSKFDAWMLGRSFPSHKTVVCDGQITSPAVAKSFANVEELMEYCHEFDHGTKTAQRVVREYLASAHMTKMSASTRTCIQSAIKHNFFKDIESLLELSKFVHTRGVDYSYKDLSNGDMNCFKEASFLKWWDYFLRVVKIVVISHVLKYPIALQYLPLEQKFGLNLPVGGFLEPYQSEAIKEFLDEDVVKTLQTISDSNDDAVTTANLINAQPDITAEEMQKQVDEFDEERIL